MAEIFIKTGELVCAGSFYRPAVSVNPGSDVVNDRIDYHKDKINDKIYLIADVKYRENTPLHDCPVFTMEIYDEENNLVESMVKNFEDQWDAYDVHDDQFVFRVPQELIFTWDSQQPLDLTYRIHLKVELHIGYWSNAGDENEFHETLADEKDIIVNLKSEKLCDCFIEVFCSTLTPVAWKHPYYLVCWFYNLTDMEMIPSEKNLYEDDLSTSHDEGKQSDLSVHPNYDQSAASIAPKSLLILRSEQLIQNWEWIQYYVTDVGPHEKRFRYNSRIDYRFPTAPDFNDFAVEPFNLTIRVSQDKINCAETSLAIWSMAWILVPAIPPLSVLYFELAALYKDIALDPIEYDPDYRKTVNYKDYLAPDEQFRNIPIELKSLYQNYNFISATNKAIQISMCRYLSGLFKNDSKSAKMQLMEIQNNFELSVMKVVEIKKLYSEAKYYIQNYQENIDMETVKKRIDDAKNDGFSSDQKSLMKKMGLSKDAIKLGESIIKDTKNINIDMKKFNDDYYYYILDKHTESLEILEYVKKINKMKKNDMLRVLRDEGLISPFEFEERLVKGNKDTCYPLHELRNIERFYLKKLAILNINTTKDLLKKGARPKDREKLSKITGISIRMINKWIHLSEFMQLGGVGENEAVLLEETGIKSIEKLSQMEKQDLKKKIFNYLKKHKKEYLKITANSNYNTWISSAKRMKN